VICANGHQMPQDSKFCTVCGAGPGAAQRSGFASLNAPTPPPKVTPTPNVTPSTPTAPVFATAATAASFSGLAIAALVTGIIGISVLAIIFGAIALSQVKKRGLRGKGMAISGLVLGIVWTAVWILAIVGSSQTYTINFSTTLYGTTCSQLSYNYSDFNQYRPVVVYSDTGQQVASGTYGSGIDGGNYAQSGNYVDTCTFKTVIRDIPKGLNNYVVDDNGEGYGSGVSYTEHQLATNNVAMNRGYSSN